MKKILLELSELLVSNEEVILPKEQVWIGKEPASLNLINQVENRLGIELPSDYKAFLKITNGLLTHDIEPNFLEVNEIDYLKNIDPYIIDAYSIEGLEDVGAQLEKSILIAGKDEEQYFLLIPPVSEDSEWKYWKFANWIPGEEIYDDLESYFKSILKFIEETDS